MTCSLSFKSNRGEACRKNINRPREDIASETFQYEINERQLGDYGKDTAKEEGDCEVVQ